MAVSELSVHQLLVFQQRELRPNQEASVEVRKAEHLEQGGNRRQRRILLPIISFRLERSRETGKEKNKKGVSGCKKMSVKWDKLVTSVVKEKIGFSVSVITRL